MESKKNDTNELIYKTETVQPQAHGRQQGCQPEGGKGENSVDLCRETLPSTERQKSKTFEVPS